MEGGIEHGNLGDIRRLLQRDLDAHEVGRVVQRRKRRDVVNLLHDGCIDQRGLAKRLTAVDHAMADGKQFRQFVDRFGLAQ